MRAKHETAEQILYDGTRVDAEEDRYIPTYLSAAVLKGSKASAAISGRVLLMLQHWPSPTLSTSAVRSEHCGTSKRCDHMTPLPKELHYLRVRQCLPTGALIT